MTNNAIISEAFDYAALDTETSVIAQQRATEIRDLVRVSMENITRAGEKLVDVQTRLARYGSGTFQQWVTQEFQWSLRTAYNYIAVYERFGVHANFAQMDIALSALYLLAAPSTPEPVVQAVLARGTAGESVNLDTVADETVRHATGRTQADVDRDIVYDRDYKHLIIAMDAGEMTPKQARQTADALYGCEPQVQYDLVQHGAMDGAFIRDMNRLYKDKSRTYYEIVDSGGIHFYEDNQYVAISRAEMKHLRRYLDIKHREYKLTAIADYDTLKAFVTTIADAELDAKNASDYAEAWQYAARRLLLYPLE